MEKTQAPQEVEFVIPSVSLLPGDREIVVRDMSKEQEGPWIAKNGGQQNLNPAINGYVFPRRAIQAVREHIPNITGDLSIYDPATSFPVVLRTCVGKPNSKDKLNLQRTEMAKLGLTWNPSKEQYEGPLSIFTPAMMASLATITK